MPGQIRHGPGVAAVDLGALPTAARAPGRGALVCDADVEVTPPGPTSTCPNSKSLGTNLRAFVLPTRVPFR